MAKKTEHKLIYDPYELVERNLLALELNVVVRHLDEDFVKKTLINNKDKIYKIPQAVVECIGKDSFYRDLKDFSNWLDCISSPTDDDFLSYIENLSDKEIKPFVKKYNTKYSNHISDYIKLKFG